MCQSQSLNRPGVAPRETPHCRTWKSSPLDKFARRAKLLTVSSTEDRRRETEGVEQRMIRYPEALAQAQDIPSTQPQETHPPFPCRLQGKLHESCMFLVRTVDLSCFYFRMFRIFRG